MDLVNIATKSMIIDILVVGVGVFVAAKVLPGISIKNFWSAFLVALLLGLANGILTWVFTFFNLHELSIFFNHGVFKFLFNAVLLMLIAKMMEDFEIKNFLFALLAAFAITVISQCIYWVIRTKLALV